MNTPPCWSSRVVRFAARFGFIAGPGFSACWLLVLLTGCSTVIKPVYQSGANAKAAPVTGRICLRVVDQIVNTAPLPKQIAEGKGTPEVWYGLAPAPVTWIKIGDQMVTPKGPYRLDAPPAMVMHRVFKEALERGGLRVEETAPAVLEVTLRRLEVVSGSKEGDFKVKIFLNLLEDVSVRHEGRTVQTVILKQQEYGGGLVMFRSELESFATEGMSQAADHALASKEIAPVLDQLRQAKAP